MNVLLKETMQVKREQVASEATTSKADQSGGNNSNNPLSNTIDLDPPSPTHHNQSR